MRVLLAVAAGLWMMGGAASAGPVSAFPAGRSIALSREAVMACRSARPIRQYLLFRQQGDSVAASKQLTIALGSGECTGFKAGDVVYVVRSDENDDVIVVRRKGDVSESHVFIKMLMTDAEVIAWDAARNGDRQVSRLARVCAAMKQTPLCSAFYYDGAAPK